MSNEDLVFCIWDPDRNAYGWFWHEADVLLHALGQEVAEKKITSAQARDVYARYYDIQDTYMIDPDDVEAEVDALQEDFPNSEEFDYLLTSSTFWEEATELGIPGVGFSKDE
jgi:hypothetical protein